MVELLVRRRTSTSPVFLWWTKTRLSFFDDDGMITKKRDCLWAVVLCLQVGCDFGGHVVMVSYAILSLSRLRTKNKIPL